MYHQTPALTLNIGDLHIETCATKTHSPFPENTFGANNVMCLWEICVSFRGGGFQLGHIAHGADGIVVPL